MDNDRGTKLVRAAAIGTAIAIVAVLATYALARSVGDPLAVTQGGSGAAETIPVFAAIAATVVGGALGAALAAIARRTSRPRRTLLVTGALGLLVSLIPPFQATTETSTALWLVAMHVVTAIPILGALRSALPEHRSPANTKRPAPRGAPTQ